MNHITTRLVLLASCFGLISTTAVAAPLTLTTKFVYQGQLKNNNQPVNGPTDFKFALYDTATNQLVASPLLFDGSSGNSPSINVSDGLFSVLLDFGEPFSNRQLSLQILVRHPAGAGNYTDLGWHVITATPFALQTRGIVVDGAGQVAIGTDPPLTPLTIQGNGGTSPVGMTQNQVGGSSTLELTTSDSASNQASRIVFRGGNDMADIEFYRGARGSETPTMKIEGNSGFVGIGETNPSTALDVNGTVQATAITTDSLSITGEFFADSLRATAGDVVAERGASAQNLTRTLSLQGARNGSGSSFAKINLNNYDNADNGGTNTLGAQISAFKTSIGSADLRFSTSQGGTLASHMTISSDGNVGIGTNTPDTKLTIDSGSTNDPAVRLTSSGTGFGSGIVFENTSAAGKTWSLYSENGGKLIFGDEDNQVAAMSIRYEAGNPVTSVQVLEIVGGSDLAEPYDIAAAAEVPPAPGMVVSIDPEHVGKLRVAEEAYDRRVAGIISGANGVNPGLVLGQKGSVADGQLPVANSGRVWCLADADANGAIAPGDMLTTSATPGHAMRASDAQRAFGAAIGKAMSSLDSGRGYVLVLVNLQ